MAIVRREKNAEVEFKLVDWADCIELVRNGLAHVHGGLIATDERIEALHFFPQEILRIRTLEFFEDDVGVRDLASMRAVTMSVNSGSAEEEFLRKSFSNIPFKTFPNGESLIKSAIDGEIPAFISDHPTGYYHLIMQRSLDRFETGPTLFTCPVQIAARLGDGAKPDRIAASVLEILLALNKWLIPEGELPP